ncbi:unnamed protein product [Meganyctiphanes norvegica]|uniref:Uncharacterized protein n=1 Tax=Meganyctiphanes norvegica TaxID=48144 RepID=A0AAV2QDV2_MEGNR
MIESTGDIAPKIHTTTACQAFPAKHYLENNPFQDGGRDKPITFIGNQKMICCPSIYLAGSRINNNNQKCDHLSMMDNLSFFNSAAKKWSFYFCLPCAPARSIYLTI